MPSYYCRSYPIVSPVVSCIVLHIQNENVERKHCFLYCLTLHSSGGPIGAASRQVQYIFFLMRDAAGFGASICAIRDQAKREIRLRMILVRVDFHWGQTSLSSRLEQPPAMHAVTEGRSADNWGASETQGHSR